MQSGNDHTVIAAGGALLLVATHVFFVLAFHAILRSRRFNFEEGDLAGERAAAAALRILDQAEYYLYVSRMGAYLCVLALAAILGSFLARAGWLTAGVGPSDFWVGAVLLLVAAVILILIYTQVLKAVAYHNPAGILRRLAVPLEVCAKIFNPVVHVSRFLLLALLKPLGLSVPVEREEAASSEEIIEMVEESSEAGKLAEHEGEMIQGVIQLSDLVVREVMTPRQDIVAVREDASLEEVTKVFTEEGFSRILVVGANLDDVRGVLMVKDLLPWVGRCTDGFSVGALMREPYSVPNTKRVRELLQDLRRTGTHLAVVLDEHGGVDGIITIEDLIEEIVGDIFDEYDRPEEEALCRRTPSGDLLVRGGALIDDLNDEYKLNIPEGDYDTIAGFVITRLGHIPTAGETVEYNGHKIKVERVYKNRIVRLRVA